jgi:hypothetical protein
LARSAKSGIHEHRPAQPGRHAFDVELRFRARAASGDPAQGMAILDTLDARHAGKAG